MWIQYTPFANLILKKTKQNLISLLLFFFISFTIYVSNILQIHKKLFKYILFAFIFHFNHGIYGPLSINNIQENSPLLFLADL